MFIQTRTDVDIRAMWFGAHPSEVYRDLAYVRARVEAMADALADGAA